MELERQKNYYSEWSCFDVISDELVSEILKRVEIKGVHRCKSVCKRWCNIIISTTNNNHFDFVALYCCYHQKQNETSFSFSFPFALFSQDTHPFYEYTKRHNRVTLIYATDTVFKSHGFSLLQSKRTPSVTVLSSINNYGLLLCSDTLNFHTRYYVCNPLTKQWVSSPPPPTAGLERAHIGFLCKATDLDIVNNSCGFVIVRIPNIGEMMRPSILKVEIYDSENGQWAESELDGGWRHNFEISMYISRFSRFWLTAVVWKGLLHWRSNQHVFVYDPSSYSSNKCRIIQLPHEEGNNPTDHRLLGECKGKLIYTCLQHRIFNMWQLKNYDGNGGEWGLLHKVLPDHMVLDQPYFMTLWFGAEYMDFRILAFHPFDEDIVFICMGGQVISFNMREKTTTYIVLLKGWLSTVSNSYLVVLPWWPVPLSRH